MNTIANLVIDPSTVLLQGASKSVPLLLGTILKIANEIREAVRRTKSNKHQCKRLSERINTLTGFLQEQKLDDTLSQPMKVALERFTIFLQECLKFIQTFTEASYFKRVWNNKDYLLQFTEFHNEFSQHLGDLNAGIALRSILINRQQDEDDRQTDIADLQQYASSINDNQHARCYPLLPIFEQNPTMTDHQREECQEREDHIFQSGIWKYRTCSNGKWQDFSHCELNFYSTSETFRGFGEDHLGPFTLNGPFSQQNRTINVTWRYKVTYSLNLQ